MNNETKLIAPIPLQFTVTKVLAGIWVVGALLGTYSFCEPGNPFTCLLFGIPGAIVGYQLIARQSCGWNLNCGIVLILAYGSFSTFAWPWLNSPFPVTSSAWYLQVQNETFADETFMKFHASADKCRAYVDFLKSKCQRNFDPPIAFHSSEIRCDPMRGPWSTDFDIGNAPPWFDPQKIEDGEYYRGDSDFVWLDTNRGVFYMYCMF